MVPSSILWACRTLLEDSIVPLYCTGLPPEVSSTASTYVAWVTRSGVSRTGRSYKNFGKQDEHQRKRSLIVTFLDS